MPLRHARPGCATSRRHDHRSAESALSAIIEGYDEHGVRFAFASVKVPVLKLMRASGLYQRLGAGRFFVNVDDAVRACMGRMGAPAATNAAS